MYPIVSSRDRWYLTTDVLSIPVASHKSRKDGGTLFFQFATALKTVCNWEGTLGADTYRTSVLILTSKLMATRLFTGGSPR